MASALPPWLTRPPSILDNFSTESSDLQDETREECLPQLTQGDDGGIPSLTREKHIQFLRNGLGKLPTAFTALDASKPWVLYWCLNGLALLGENVSEYRQNVLTTLTPLQNRSGGFGGGYGQYSHLATTYAAALSLTVVGDDALDMVDRQAMWKWLGELKQPEGDFEVCRGGERDVRGTYCAVTIISLFNLPLELPASSPARMAGCETFLDKLPEWIGQCQTYEGGFSSVPGGEAHGAYTFCALACLSIIGEPSVVMNRHIDVHQLISWLARRQSASEGGFAGRTNKLVDGCYSHWIGGCWSLVESATTIHRAPGNSTKPLRALWDRQGLQRYILCCCQGPRGGLRDKPSRPPDTYHSCYNLAGLSSATYLYLPQDKPDDDLRPLATAGLHWLHGTESISGIEEEVAPMNPTYVVPWGAAEKARSRYESSTLC